MSHCEDGSEYCVRHGCLSAGDEFKYVQWGNVKDNAGVIYGVSAVPVYKNNHRLMEVGLGGLSIEDVGKEEEIGKISTKRQAQLAFRWIGQKLFVFDKSEGTFITTIQK